VVNLIVHITLPKGIKLLVTGAVLQADVTFDVCSGLTPYYASIDQVRLDGGMYIRKLADLTVASSIYSTSREADMLCSHPPTDTTSEQYMRYAGARNQWVTLCAARDLILNVIGLQGAPGTHVLANFSVTRQRGLEGESIGEKVAQLRRDIALYDPTLRSCGLSAPGGRPRPGMAAKGVLDWSEKTPGRTWANTGLGANAKSADFGSPTGGRGKPMGFFASTFYSPPLVSLRSGIYQGAYPLIITNPWPTSI
jgi:hypothetical protein